MIGIKATTKTNLDPQGMIRYLHAYRNVDWKTLGEFAEDVVTEDNRSSVLAGKDKKGRNLTEVKYRPRPRTLKIRLNKTLSYRKKNSRTFGTTKFPFQGSSKDNLTSSQYRSLTGPPLAPQREMSRVITNFVTKSRVKTYRGVPGVTLEFGWADIVSKKGKPFIEAHFKGLKGLPKRDLRGMTIRAKNMIERELEAKMNLAIDEAKRSMKLQVRAL